MFEKRVVYDETVICAVVYNSTVFEPEQEPRPLEQEPRPPEREPRPPTGPFTAPFFFLVCKEFRD